MTEPRYDLVVFGATSFVGQILCRYLIDQFGVGGALRWAAAGRSEGKLKVLRDSLGEKAKALPLLMADASNEAELNALCAQTRVVASTVGPYALFGEPLVKVCAETGTDYCDLTGEVQWIGRMIRKYEPAAKKSGARIIHCCGFDSIPSDMGVYFLQSKAREALGAPCTDVKMRVKAMKGGMSGGTVASMVNVAKEAIADPKLRKELANPYSLCSEGHGFSARQHNMKGAEMDQDSGSWIAPFVMGAINTRVVHRSNFLTQKAYGNDFRYEEAFMTGKHWQGRLTGLGISLGLASFMVAAAIKPTRWLLERFILPSPGEGPTPEQQEKGFFDLRFVGTTDQGEVVRASVTGDRDPGYGSTAKMLGQAAACLALDLPKQEKAGGFWTPSTALGDKLLKRLTAYSGLTFELVQR